MGNQKIFFSYSRVDGGKVALKLAADLRKVGANVWIDQLNIKGGTIWDEEIEKTLQTSDCILFIATAKSINNNNVLNEVYYALEENKQVIPVLFDSVKMPFRLKRLQHIDFTVDYDIAFNRLLEALNLPNQPAVVPEQPVIKEDTGQIKDAEPINIENQSSKESEQAERQKEQHLWNNLVKDNTVSSYIEYLAIYPQGEFKEEARKKINELNQIEEEAKAQVSGKESKSSGVLVDEHPGQGKKIANRRIIKVIGIIAAVLLLIVIVKNVMFSTRSKYNESTSPSTIITDSINKAGEISSGSPGQNSNGNLKDKDIANSQTSGQSVSDTKEPENKMVNENNKGTQYFVISSKAFFHNTPDPSTRRKGYLVKNDIINALQESGGFVYVEFENKQGTKSKGWVSKDDLQLNK